MTALEDWTGCPTCSKPFVEVRNEVVRHRGTERVAVLACATGHEYVHTTTLVSLRRAHVPPQVATVEDARLVSA